MCACIHCTFLLHHFLHSTVGGCAGDQPAREQAAQETDHLHGEQGRDQVQYGL